MPPFDSLPTLREITGRARAEWEAGVVDVGTIIPSGVSREDVRSREAGERTNPPSAHNNPWDDDDDQAHQESRPLKRMRDSRDVGPRPETATPKPSGGSTTGAGAGEPTDRNTPDPVLIDGRSSSPTRVPEPTILSTPSPLRPSSSRSPSPETSPVLITTAEADKIDFTSGH
jgi:hypothetical protein